MDIVIVGAGRVGARLAGLLSESHAVTIVDRSPAAFDRLPNDFLGKSILGNGIDMDVLREAGVGSADIFLALTEFDNSNIMAAEAAQQLGARNVVARLYDPVRGEAFGRRGITTVSPTAIGAMRLFELVTGEEVA